MPEKIDNEFIHDVPKSIQAQIARLREDVGSVKLRLSSIDTPFGLVHTDMAHLSDRMDRLETRMERVEARLSLYDPQH